MRAVIERALISTVVWALMLTAARAQSLEEARGLYDAADFAASVDVYDEVLRSPSLTREQLMGVFRGRALANIALGSTTSSDRDIRSMLSLDPEAVLGDEAPPAVQAHVDAIRETITRPLSITGTAIPTPDGWTVQVAIRGDVVRLVKKIEVLRRAAESGEFVREETNRRRVDYPPSQRLVFYVVAYGVGDSVLATHGSDTSPIEVDGGLSPEQAEEPIEDPAEEPIEDPVEEPITTPVPTRRGLRIGLGVGAAAFAVLLIAIIAASAGGSSGTQPGGPIEVE